MEAKITPEEMVARLLYRDGLMLVIDKPAGIAVHRGPKGGESLEDHFGALRFGLPRAPALAHRLDRETSGCLVLGRHRKALATLGRLFKTGVIGKTYWAVVEGSPAEDEGVIDLPLGRRDEARGWWMRPDPHGQPAVTRWKVMGRAQFGADGDRAEDAEVAQITQRAPIAQTADSDFRAERASSVPSPHSPSKTGVNALVAGEGQGGGWSRESRTHNDPPPHPSPARGEGAGPSWGQRVDSPRSGTTTQLTWLALEPVTGRTHQLRVHCAAMGFPILGDTIYGTTRGPRIDTPPLHLHSREVVVPLYRNREPIHASAPVPLAMQERLYACGWQGEVFKLVD